MKYLNRFIIMTSVLILSAGCGPGDIFHEDLDLFGVQITASGESSSIPISDIFSAEGRSDIRVGDSGQLTAVYSDSSRTLEISAPAGAQGFTAIELEINERTTVLPFLVMPRISHRFALKGYGRGDTVSVFGNFNSWNRTEHRLEYDTVSGEFSTDLFFEPGKYEYRFQVNGQDILDPGNSDRVPNGLGDFNSLLVIEAPFSGRMPHITPFGSHAGKDGSRVLEFVFLPGDYSGNILKSDLLFLLGNERISEKYFVCDENKSRIILHLPAALVSDGKQDIRVVFSRGPVYSNVLHLMLKNGDPLPVQNEFQTWNDAVIYSIMTDRFNNGDAANDAPVSQPGLSAKGNFMGGDLAGILEKINEGYFNMLGVNTLWISPWYMTTDSAYPEYPEPHRLFTGYHGYWPVEPRTVEPRYGDSDVLHALVDAAHSQGIRVLMDFVSNHVHEEHPYYRNHRNWFGVMDLPDGRRNLRLWDEQRLTTWFDTFMPSFDYEGSPEARDQVVSDAVWWVETYGLDGFRHDAVKHVPNSFWRELTQTLKEKYPDRNLYQIGETFGDWDLVSSYVNAGQLSAQFNFNQYWPARYGFTEESGDLTDLREAMEKSLEVYGQLNVMANIMDSHDQPRLPSYMEKDLKWDENGSEVGWVRAIKVDNPETYDRIAVYYAYLMSSPGVPAVYYGNEIGMTGAGDPDNRRMMRWGEDVSSDESHLRTRISSIIGLRNRHSALRYGDLIFLHSDTAALAYLRSDMNERVLTVLNKNSSPVTLKLRMPEELGVRRVELLQGEPCKTFENGRLNLDLPGYSYGFYNLK